MVLSIGIDKQNNLPSGGETGHAAGAAVTNIHRIVPQADVGVLCNKRIHDFAGAVTGIIINDEHLEGVRPSRKGLAPLPDGFLNVLGLIKAGKTDADRWLRGFYGTYGLQRLGSLPGKRGSKTDALRARRSPAIGTK